MKAGILFGVISIYFWFYYFEILSDYKTFLAAIVTSVGSSTLIIYSHFRRKKGSGELNKEVATQLPPASTNK